MKSLAGWLERSSRVAPQSHRPANKQFFRATGWMSLADKRRANIEAAAWKDTQCELDVRRIRDREDSACKPVSSPARFNVGKPKVSRPPKGLCVGLSREMLGVRLGT